MAREVIESKNLDAAQTVFFETELESVKSKTYDKKFPNLQARMLFPVSFEAGPAAETIAYYQYDQVGMAKIIASYADDLPRADVRAKKFTANVEGIGTSYGYSIQDIRAAAATGKPLEQRKATAARRAIEARINAVAFVGDAAHNLPGFLTNPNIPSDTAGAKTGGGTAWSGASATADEIAKDLFTLVDGIMEDTNMVESADTLLLPPAKYNLIKRKRIGDDASKTILAYFLENSPNIKAVVPVNELTGAGPLGVDIAVAYRRDPDAVTLEIPQDFEQFAAQENNLEFKVPCHARICGVLLPYPMSAAILEGI